MKINEKIKYEDLPQYVKDHLMFFDPFNKNYMALGLPLLGIDIIIIVPLLYPIDVLFLCLILPLLIIIHIWAIRLFIKNFYSIQLELIIYSACTFAVGSYAYFLIGIKMAYYYIGITNVKYYILCGATYLISIIILIIYQIKKYSNIKGLNEEEKKLEEKKRYRAWQYAPLLSAGPGLGYTISHRWILKSDELAVNIVVPLCYFVAITYAYLSAKNFHKYFFIKANPKYVIYLKPSKKEIKEMRKKGKEIIIK